MHKACAVLAFCLSLWLSASEKPKVTRGDFRKVITLNGSLNAARSEEIAAPRGDSWQIQIMWMIDEGTEVQPGDPIVRFDNTGMVEKLRNLEQEIIQKKVELEKKKSEGEALFQEKELELKTKTIDFKKADIDAAVPADLQKALEYNQAQLNLTRAETELKDARQALATAKKNQISEESLILLDIEKKVRDYQRSKQRAQAMEISARTGGIVIYQDIPWEGRKVQEGDTVQATFGVLSIPDLSSLEVEAWVSETELGLVAPGQKANLVLDAYPDLNFSGTVLGISSRGEERDQFGKAAWFRVRIAINEPDPIRMRPGMSIRTEIQVEQWDDVLLVPMESVGYKDNQWWVSTVEGNPLVCEPLGNNAFHLALKPDSGLREGMDLKPWGRP